MTGYLLGPGFTQDWPALVILILCGIAALVSLALIFSKPAVVDEIEVKNCRFTNEEAEELGVVIAKDAAESVEVTNCRAVDPRDV